MVNLTDASESSGNPPHMLLTRTRSVAPCPNRQKEESRRRSSLPGFISSKAPTALTASAPESLRPLLRRNLQGIHVFRPKVLSTIRGNAPSNGGDSTTVQSPS